MSAIGRNRPLTVPPPRWLVLNKQTGKYSELKSANWRFCRGSGLMEDGMKNLLLPTLAAAFAISFTLPAQAATNKHKVSADVQAACKDRAAKKFSAIHFLKRRDYVNNCIAQHANAKKPAKEKPAAANRTAPSSTTGQAPAR